MRRIFRFLFVAVLLTWPLSAEAKTARVVWQPEPMDVSVGRGTTEVFAVEVTSDSALQNVRFDVSADLAPFVTVTPGMLAVLNSGVPAALQVPNLCMAISSVCWPVIRWSHLVMLAIV